jgi:hypothetical protein
MRDTYDLMHDTTATLALYPGREDGEVARYRPPHRQRDVFIPRYRQGQARRGLAKTEVARRMGLVQR